MTKNGYFGLSSYKIYYLYPNHSMFVLLSFSIYLSTWLCPYFTGSIFDVTFQATISPFDLPLFGEVTFTAQNQTDANVGVLSIHLDNGTYASIDIASEGIFTTSFSNMPIGCSIREQPLQLNNPTSIVLDAHTLVRVTWTGNVVVVDDKVTY